jgi:hypothetical protein
VNVELRQNKKPRAELKAQLRKVRAVSSSNASKADLQRVKVELKASIAQLKASIAQLKGHLREVRWRDFSAGFVGDRRPAAHFRTVGSFLQEEPSR